MPQIPKLTRTVQEQATPRVAFSTGASPAAFGGGQAADLAGLGGGLATAGRATTSVAGEWQRREEDADLNAAVAEWRDEARNILSGKDGILLREGRDAAGATNDATAKLQELKQKYGQRFFTARARDSWEEWSSRAVASHLDRVSSHEAIEGKRWQDTARKARLMSAVQAIIEHRDNPADALDYEAEITGLVEKGYGDMGPDVVAQQKAANLNAAHAGAIDAFRKAEEFAEADEWLTLYGDRLNPTYRAEAEGAVKKRVKEDELLAMALSLADSGAPLEEQIKAINENVTDAKARDTLVARVKEEDAFKTETAKRKQTEAGEAALKEARAAFEVQDWDWRPSGTLGETHLNAIDMLRERSKKAFLEGKHAVESVDSTKAELWSIAKSDYATFHDLPLEMWASQLTAKDYDELRDKQIKGASSPEQWDADILVVGKRALDDAGIRDIVKNTKARAAYFTRLKAEAAALKADDYAGLKNLAKDLLVEVTIERPLWFDTTKRRYEIEPEEPTAAMPTQGTMGGGYIPAPAAKPSPAPAPSAQTIPAAPEEPRPAFIPPGYTRNPKTGNYERIENGRVVRVLSPVDGRRIK